MLSHASLRFAIRNLTFTKNAPVNELKKKKNTASRQINNPKHYNNFLHKNEKNKPVKIKLLG